MIDLTVDEALLLAEGPDSLRALVAAYLEMRQENERLRVELARCREDMDRKIAG